MGWLTAGFTAIGKCREQLTRGGDVLMMRNSRGGGANLLRSMLKIRLRSLFLLLLVAAIAVFLSQRWHQRNWATLTWLGTESEVAPLLQHTVLTVKSDGEYFASVNLRHRGCDELWSALQKQHRRVHPNVSIRSTNDLYHVIEFSSSSKQDLDQAVAWWQQEDQVQPGQTLINGVLLDRHGLPMADCSLDLIGPEPLIGKCRSRYDGTFAMPMLARSGNYYLRIHDVHGRVETRTRLFGLDGQSPQHTMQLQVPIDAPPALGGGGFN